MARISADENMRRSNTSEIGALVLGDRRDLGEEVTLTDGE